MPCMPCLAPFFLPVGILTLGWRFHNNHKKFPLFFLCYGLNTLYTDGREGVEGQREREHMKNEREAERKKERERARHEEVFLWHKLKWHLVLRDRAVCRHFSPSTFTGYTLVWHWACLRILSCFYLSREQHFQHFHAFFTHTHTHTRRLAPAYANNC